VAVPHLGCPPGEADALPLRLPHRPTSCGFVAAYPNPRPNRSRRRRFAGVDFEHSESVQSAVFAFDDVAVVVAVVVVAARVGVSPVSSVH